MSPFLGVSNVVDGVTMMPDAVQVRDGFLPGQPSQVV
jgi:hypothetical protein